MAVWGVLAAGLGLVVYSLLSYLLMAHAPDRAWTVLALFGPLLAALAVAGLARRHLPTLAGCAAATLMLVLVWQRGGVDLNRLYVLQHGAIHALLAWTFAFTLRPGSMALITAMAEKVHLNPLTTAERRYTRSLTLAWVLYFVAMIVISVLLYALAPWAWWSFFCAVLTPGAALAFFIVEYLWRRWQHPDFSPVSVQRALRAWQQQANPSTTGRPE